MKYRLITSVAAALLTFSSFADIVDLVNEAIAKRTSGEVAEVVLKDGVYEMGRTLLLGTNESQVLIRAEHPGKAIIVGGRAFRGRDFKVTKDGMRVLTVPGEMREAFEKGRHQGGGQWKYRNFDRYEPLTGGKFDYPTYPMLSVDCRRMELARWPNEGYFWPAETNIVCKPAKGVDALVSTRTGREAKWNFDDTDIAAAGFTGCTYLNQCLKVSGYDMTNQAIRISTDRLDLERSRLYFFNIKEELDCPGEWFYDKKSGELLLCPPDSFNDDSICAIGTTYDPLFHITGNNVKLEGLAFTSKIGHPVIIIEQGHDNVVKNCRFSALGYDALVVCGRRNAVRDCEFEEVTATPITIQGGILKTMERGDNVVDNCRIRKFSILHTSWGKGGIFVDGVGNTVSHCDISDTIEIGLTYAGYANTIEYNRVYDVAKEFDDTGVVYSPGGARCFGNVFRYNDLSGNPGQNVVFYLDDTTSGHTVYGNIFRDAGNMGSLIGGGRGNVISNNLIIGSFSSLQIDNRGLYWPSYERRTDRQHRDEVIMNTGITNEGSRVAAAFPDLKRMLLDESVPYRSYADNVWTHNVILDPFGFSSVRKFAKGRYIPEDRLRFENNLCVRTHGPIGPYDPILHPESMPTNSYSSNLESIATPIGKCRLLDGTPENPIDLGFIDVPAPRFNPWPYFMTYAQQAWIDMPMLLKMRSEGFEKALGLKPYVKGDFNLKPDARIMKEMPGWQPIPWNEIGLR